MGILRHYQLLPSPLQHPPRLQRRFSASAVQYDCASLFFARHHSSKSHRPSPSSTTKASAFDTSDFLSWLNKEQNFALDASKALSPDCAYHLRSLAIAELRHDTTPPPDSTQLNIVTLTTFLAFAGFGFVDNFVMITTGEAIDNSVCVLFGFSTLAAAGLGNLVSDLAGLMLKGTIENSAGRLGIPDANLSPTQMKHPAVRFRSLLGCVVGVTIGCIVGMCPLLWLEADDADTFKRKRKVQDLLLMLADEIPRVIDAEHVALYLANDIARSGGGTGGGAPLHHKSSGGHASSLLWGKGTTNGGGEFGTRSDAGEDDSDDSGASLHNIRRSQGSMTPWPITSGHAAHHKSINHCPPSSSPTSPDPQIHADDAATLTKTASPLLHSDVHKSSHHHPSPLRLSRMTVTTATQAHIFQPRDYPALTALTRPSPFQQQSTAGTGDEDDAEEHAARQADIDRKSSERALALDRISAGVLSLHPAAERLFREKEVFCATGEEAAQWISLCRLHPSLDHLHPSLSLRRTGLYDDDDDRKWWSDFFTEKENAAVAAALTSNLNATPLPPPHNDTAAATIDSANGKSSISQTASATLQPGERPPQLEAGLYVPGMEPKNVLCAPIINLQGTTVGFIEVINCSERKKFDEQDIHLLRAIASHIALHLDAQEDHIHQQPEALRAVCRMCREQFRSGEADVAESPGWLRSQIRSIWRRFLRISPVEPSLPTRDDVSRELAAIETSKEASTPLPPPSSDTDEAAMKEDDIPWGGDPV